MAYLLPININSRRYYRAELQFVDNQELDIPIFEFIIKKDRGVKSNLLSLNATDKILQSLEGYKHDLKIGTPIVEWKENGQSEINVSVLQISLHSGKDSSKDDTSKGDTESNMKKLEEKGLKINNHSVSGGIKLFSIDLINQFPVNKTFLVSIICRKKFQASFYVHVCNHSSLRRVALDFGSEATQVAYKTGNTQDKLMPMNIIRQLKRDRYYNREKYQDNGFLQYDREDNFTLLKSVFFISRNVESLEEIRTTKPQDTDPLKLLSSKDDPSILRTDNIPIPNFKLSKISDYGGEEELNERGFDTSIADKEDTIRHLILNKILHSVLYRLRPAKGAKEKKYFFNIKFLVPNIYSQEIVSNMIENLYKDLRKIKEEPGNPYQIAGVEISTISESDASFCGFVDIKRAEKNSFLTQNANYLIVDAGKGTMDFSILQSGKMATEFTGIYRSGIPGSGQFISFAIMEAVSAELGISIYDMVREIGKLPFSEKQRWLDEIERIKIGGLIDVEKYPENNEKPEDYEPTVNSIDGSKLVNMLSDIRKGIENGKRGKIQDRYGFVNSAADTLIEELNTQLEKIPKKYKKFHRIILTGRSFKYQILNLKIQDFLSKYLIGKSKEGFVEDLDRMKSVCMHGALSDFCVVNYNADVTGNLIIKRAETSDQIDRMFKSLFGQTNKQLIYQVDEKLFWGLSEQYHYNPGDDFYIGGLNYGIPADAYSIPDGKSLKIGLRNAKYILRDANNFVNLTPNTSVPDDKGILVLRSVFPFAGVSKLLEKSRTKQIKIGNSSSTDYDNNKDYPADKPIFGRTDQEEETNSNNIISQKDPNHSSKEIINPKQSADSSKKKGDFHPEEINNGADSNTDKKGTEQFSSSNRDGAEEKLIPTNRKADKGNGQEDQMDGDSEKNKEKPTRRDKSQNRDIDPFA